MSNYATYIKQMYILSVIKMQERNANISKLMW